MTRRKGPAKPPEDGSPVAPIGPLNRSEASPRGPFRIQTVAEMTGVPEPTLRAWERRYGVPSPERTASGYRLYGPADVEHVREMRRLCDEGMAAAEAARVLLAGKTLAPQDRVEFDVYAAATRTMVDAVVAFDDKQLDLELRKLTFLGTVTSILDRVVTPVLREIGERWHDGRLSVAEEHLASQRIGTFLRDLLRLSLGAESQDSAVLACFADEEHELGLLGAATRLSGWGLRPIFLGARTPPGAVRSAVRGTSPALVGLSVTVPPPRARARELIEEYASACDKVPWVVGGTGVNAIADLVRKHGGVVAPDESSQLRAKVRALMKGAGRNADEGEAAVSRRKTGKKTR